MSEIIHPITMAPVFLLIFRTQTLANKMMILMNFHLCGQVHLYKSGTSKLGNWFNLSNRFYFS